MSARRHPIQLGSSARWFGAGRSGDGAAGRRGAGGMLGARLDPPAAVYVASLSTWSSRSTLIDALKRAARFFGSSPGEIDWASLRFAHLSALRAHLIESVAPATGNKVLSAVRGVLRYAARLDLMPHEAMSKACDVESIRGHREPKGRALAPEEIAGMVAACAGRGLAGDRDRALLGLLFGAGLRRAEAMLLDVGAVSTDELRVRGKGNKERLVPVPASVRRAVELWESVRGVPIGAPLFVRFTKGRPTSSRLSPSGLYIVMQRLGARAGLAHFSPHDLRRTYIGELFDTGADIKTIQDLV